MASSRPEQETVPPSLAEWRDPRILPLLFPVVPCKRRTGHLLSQPLLRSQKRSFRLETAHLPSQWRNQPFYPNSLLDKLGEPLQNSPRQPRRDHLPKQVDLIQGTLE